MMRQRLIGAAIAAAMGLIAAPAVAQSLADVARQEEARRKTAKKAVRTLSNADLSPSEIAPASASAPATEGCLTSVKAGKCVAAEEVIANSVAEPPGEPQVKTSEATVRQQANQIRQRLLKVQQEFDTLNASANDPSRSPGERNQTARLAAQRETMLASVEKQWRALEKLVADEELPREWLDPIPLLSTRTPQ